MHQFYRLLAGWLCSKPSGRDLARSNQDTDDGKNASPCLTQNAPYTGLGAESEEKREPASDIDTAVVVSLKALDPIRPIRVTPKSGTSSIFRMIDPLKND